MSGGGYEIVRLALTRAAERITLAKNTRHPPPKYSNRSSRSVNHSETLYPISSTDFPKPSKRDSG